ncbi:hypothetical protein [Streptomyces sp. NPDC048650]|uniref:hypothetical protein n=1 Tax=unclassified Streptomyces TaxID=2593676 RepID=UPI00371B0B30
MNGSFTAGWTPMAVAVCALALALVWRAGLVLSDARSVRRDYARAGAYRPGRGWTGPDALAAECRRAASGLLLGVALPCAAFLPPGRCWGAAATLLCCSAALWPTLGYGRLRQARYTTVCLLVLAAAVALGAALVLLRVPRSAQVTGGFASFFAAQLYLVAGARKLRSRHFMSGRVLVDNAAYNACQAATGSRDFLPVPGPRRLTALLAGPAFPAACRAAAVLTAAGELALGLGALGVVPAASTLALAVPSHLAFTAVSPRRIVPFSALAFGLLVLATSHPLL